MHRLLVRLVQRDLLGLNRSWSRSEVVKDWVELDGDTGRLVSRQMCHGLTAEIGAGIDIHGRFAAFDSFRSAGSRSSRPGSCEIRSVRVRGASYKQWRPLEQLILNLSSRRNQQAAIGRKRQSAEKSSRALVTVQTLIDRLTAGGRDPDGR